MPETTNSITFNPDDETVDLKFNPDDEVIPTQPDTYLPKLTLPPGVLPPDQTLPEDQRQKLIAQGTLSEAPRRSLWEQFRDLPGTEFFLGSSPRSLALEPHRGVFSPDPNIHPLPVAGPQTNKVKAVAAALYNPLAQMGNQIAGNPLSVAPLMVTGGESAGANVIPKITEGIYAAIAAKQAPEALVNAVNTAANPKASFQDKVSAFADAGYSTAMATGLATHIAKTGIKLPQPEGPAEYLAREIDTSDLEPNAYNPLKGITLTPLAATPLPNQIGAAQPQQFKQPTEPVEAPNLGRSWTPGPAGTKRAQPVVVPETPPEPERAMSIVDEIRRSKADTTAKVQALFPEANFTREQAAALRRQAFPQTVQPKTTAAPEIAATTEEKPNASSEQKAAEVHGDVQPQSRQSEGQVPEPEGGRGIQPQTGGGLREPAEAAQSEVPLTRPPGVKADAKEWITQAAYKDEAGDVFTGQNHPQILENLGVEGFESRESRNTPQFGYVTSKGRFVTRPQAAPIAEAAGQQLEPFDTNAKGEPQPHSDEIQSPVQPGKSIGEAKPLNPGGALKDLPPELQAKSNAVKEQMAGEAAKVKAQQQVTKVAATEGTRPAKEIKNELVSRLEKAVADAKPEAELLAKETVKIKTGQRVSGKPIESEVPLMEARKGTGQSGAPLFQKEYLAALEKNVPKITIEIPGDGTFTIFNTKEAVQTVLDKAKRLDTTSGAKNAPFKRRGLSDADKAWVKDQLAQKRPNQTQVEPQPQPIGMGGAVPGEFEKSTGTPTSIKNATVDQERAKRGLPPAMEPQRRAFGEVWNRAMAEIDRDPLVQDKLIKELEDKPRALTDVEDALLLHRQIDLHNEYGKATREMANYDPRTNPAMVEQYKLIVADLSDRLLQLYNVGKRAGTETGRGLNARKMMANEDFSLAQMELSLRAAKGGEPLTEEEHTKLVSLQKRIEDLEKQVNERDAQRSTVRSETAGKAAMPELQRKAAAEGKGRNAKSPDEQRDQALTKLRERVAAGEEPKDLGHLIQMLARAFVRMGINERVPLVNKVHGIIKDILPDMTWRQTMDAISGYGDFRPLSRDEISVKLRDLKGQMQQASKLLDMVQGEPPAKTGFERRTPTAAESEMIKQVNEAKKRFGIHTENPNKLKSALATAKTRLNNQIEDLQQRLAEGNYSKKPRTPTPLDAEGERLKAQRDRLKEEFDRQVLKERLRNRTTFEKTQDALVKWSRAFLLSGPQTLAKLTGAAALRLAITPAEEVVGAGLSKAFPSLAARAPREGGMSVRAEARALTDGFTKGMADAWQTLKTGKSDLDVLYGKRGGLPPEATDFLGHIHGALKAPVKRAEFARSFQKRAELLMRNGVDVSDPLVQTRIAVEAYKDANRAIFMQDNQVVKAWRAGMATLSAVEKQTGHVPAERKAIATTLNAAFPIVKVPTNIVAEAIDYATGLVTGSAKLAKAFHDGIETLTPEQGDEIMRQMKKGSLGAAVMLLGYYAPQIAGGYYQAGEKRPKSEVPYDAVRVGGQNIPANVAHHPLLDVLQLGATVRRVADSEHRGERKGMSEGLWAGGLGLLDEVPFVREQQETIGLMDPRSRDAYLAELGRQRLTPALLQYIAEHTDKDAQGNIIPRQATGVVQGVESGVPGLREKLPEKEQRRR